MKGLFSIILVLLIAVILCSPVYGTEADRLEARHLMKEAEFVFQGVVTNIESRVSDTRTRNDLVLPHTFVTFNIEEVLKGKSEKKTITLRFQGGRQEVGEGEDAHFQYLLVSMVPLFDIGDRDILFVKGNGTLTCPTVGMNKGRFRIIEDSIYTDLGQPVVLTDNLQKTLSFQSNDIIEPKEIFNRLLNPKSDVDKQMSSRVSETTLKAIAAAQKACPNSAEENYAKSLLARDLNKITHIEELESLTGVQIGAADATAQSEKIILFSVQDLSNISLREQTQALITKDPSLLSKSEALKLNRLLVEDIFPSSIIKSLDKTLMTVSVDIKELSPKVIEEVTQYKALCDGCELQMKITPSEDLLLDTVVKEGSLIDSVVRNDIDTTSPLEPENENRQIQMMSSSEFISYLEGSISTLHTVEELRSLAPVASVNIKKPFYVSEISPGLPTLDIVSSAAFSDTRTELEILEEQALEESGFNPVLDAPRPE